MADDAIRSEEHDAVERPIIIVTEARGPLTSIVERAVEGVATTTAAGRGEHGIREVVTFAVIEAHETGEQRGREQNARAAELASSRIAELVAEGDALRNEVAACRAALEECGYTGALPEGEYDRLRQQVERLTAEVLAWRVVEDGPADPMNCCECAACLKDDIEGCVRRKARERARRGEGGGTVNQPRFAIVFEFGDRRIVGVTLDGDFYSIDPYDVIGGGGMARWHLIGTFTRSETTDAR